MPEPMTPERLAQARVLAETGAGGWTNASVNALLDEIDRLKSAPAAVWWLKSDDDFGYDDPEVHLAEGTAKAEAIRSYRDANQIGLFEDDPEPDFAWREHREGGIELYVDAEATGLIVRQLTVKGAATPVTTDA